MTKLSLPVQISNKVGCPRHLQYEGESVGDVFDHAIAEFPELGNKIFATPGKINRFIRLFVDGKNCAPNIYNVQVSTNTEIKVLIAMAGG